MGFQHEQAEGRRPPVAKGKVGELERKFTTDPDDSPVGTTCGCTPGKSMIATGETRGSSGKSYCKVGEVSGKYSGNGRPGQTSGKGVAGLNKMGAVRGRV